MWPVHVRPKEELIHIVKQLQGIHGRMVCEPWHRMCKEVGTGRDVNPAAHPPEFLDHFVRVAEGIVAQNAELVRHAKNVGSSSPEAKQAWIDLCEAEGGGFRDPRKHEAWFLQKYLDMMGGSHVAQPAPERRQLVAEVKAMQKGSASAKQRWVEFCVERCNSVYDPKSIRAELLRQWLDEMESAAAPDLVRRVKTLQSKSAAFIADWNDVCDREGCGTRDPLRHDNTFLRQFLDEHPKEDYEELVLEEEAGGDREEDGEEEDDDDERRSPKFADVPGLPAADLRGGAGGAAAKGTHARSPCTGAPDALFVGGLPNTAKKETVTEYFSLFGEVKSVLLKKGFAFVSFASAESGQAVLDNAANNFFEGAWIDCKVNVRGPEKGAEKRAKKGGAKGSAKGGGKPLVEKDSAAAPEAEEEEEEWDRLPAEGGLRLYVGGLPPEATDADLEERFSEYGELLEAKVVLDRTKSSRGFGFVTLLVAAEDQERLLSDEHLILAKRAVVRRADSGGPSQRSGQPLAAASAGPSAKRRRGANGAALR